MKKFLKILLIVIGIVFLIFAALICIGLFVDYDDHIENGRYTYVPEEENKGNEYIEFKLTDNGKDDSKLTYYNSIEEAILNSPLKAEHEDLSAPEDFLNHVDEILHIWNGKQYDTIFYRAGSDNDPVQGFVIARCKKQIENESTQYAFVNATPSATTPDTTYGGDFKKFIHLSLTISDIQQDLNPNYPDTRFVFGYLQMINSIFESSRTYFKNDANSSLNLFITLIASSLLLLALHLTSTPNALCDILIT